jgi:hypothetical protein
MRTILSRHAGMYLLSFCIFALPAFAQQDMARLSLPEAPAPQQDQTAGTASVSGTILDSGGAIVPQAQVSLVQKNGEQVQTSKSDANGQFSFAEVPPGPYFVTVEAAGFAPFRTQEFSITAQQRYVVPDISLAVAGLNTNVIVRPADEIAAEQIKAEEKQRVVGIFPNYYVSYVPDAAPLTSKQKFSLAIHDTFDWTTFIGVSMGAGLEQATNRPSGYGQGAAGYGKRWGALFADGRSSDLLSHYVFASLLHQDPRYFYQGTGTTKSRLYHAVGSAFVARSDSGKTMPNYSYLLGDICAGAISNAYYPGSDRGAGLVFTNAAIGIAGRAAQAVVQEFLAKRLTKNVPKLSSSGSTDPNASASLPNSSAASPAPKP